MPRPKGSKNRPKERIEDGTPEPPAIVEKQPDFTTKPPDRLLLRKMVPEGPYKSEPERWDAIDAFMRLKAARELEGASALKNTDVENWMGLSIRQILTEANKTAFVKWRAAGSKREVYGMMTGQVSNLNKIYTDIIKRAVESNDPDEKLETLRELSKFSEQWGFSKTDMSHGDATEAFDTEASIKEAWEIVQHFVKHPPRAEQNLIAVVTSGVPEFREVAENKVGETGDHTETVKDGADAGPGDSLPTVPMATEAVGESEEIPADGG